MFVLRLKKKRFIIALTAVLAVITAFLVIINADFTSVLICVFYLKQIN